MSDVKFVAKSDFEQVKKDYLALARHTAKVETENRKLQAATRDVGNAAKVTRNEQTKGATSAITHIREMAGAYLGVSAAIGAVRSALQFMNAEQEKAIGGLDKLRDLRDKLAQISETPEQFKAIEKHADELAIRHGFDRDATRALAFSAKSEGFERVESDILRASRGTAQVEALSTLAGSVANLFEKEKLTSESAMSMGFAAAAMSKLDIKEMSPAIATAAEGGKAAEASAVEVFAATSALASKFASGQTAADRIKAFGFAVDKADDPRVKDKGIIEAVRAAKQFSPDELESFLGGSTEVKAGFEALAESLDEIERRAKIIARERDLGIGAGSSFAQQVNIRQRDETFKADREMTSARVRREVANEQQNLAKPAAAQVTIDEKLAQLKESDKSLASQFGAQRAGEAAKFMQGGATTTAVAASIGAKAGEHFTSGPLGPFRAIADAFGMLTDLRGTADREGITAAKRRDALQATDQRQQSSPIKQASPVDRQPSDSQISETVKRRQDARRGQALQHLRQFNEPEATAGNDGAAAGGFGADLFNQVKREIEAAAAVDPERMRQLSPNLDAAKRAAGERRDGFTADDVAREFERAKLSPNLDRARAAAGQRRDGVTAETIARDFERAKLSPNLDRAKAAASREPMDDPTNKAAADARSILDRNLNKSADASTRKTEELLAAAVGHLADISQRMNAPTRPVATATGNRSNNRAAALAEVSRAIA